MGRKKKLPDATNTKFWAEFWGVTDKTIRNWRKEDVPVPFSLPESMVSWASTRQEVPPGVTRKLKSLGFDETIKEDPDWNIYQSGKAERKNAGEPEEDTANLLEDYRGFYSFKLLKANKHNKRSDAEFFSGQVIKFDKAIRENKLLAEKLGIQSGETIRRDACERWIRSWVYWTMRGVDSVLAELCPKVAAAASSLSVEQVRDLMEPLLLEHRLLIPFARSAKLQAALAMPSWLIEQTKDSVDDYIESGGAAFDAAGVNIEAASTPAAETK